MTEDLPEQNPPPPLYVWLGNDPLATPADTTIDDPPGVSDLQLLAEAIVEGRLGQFLPIRIAISSHERPSSSGYRSVDVARLLRDHRIPHRRRIEVLPYDSDDTASE